MAKKSRNKPHTETPQEKEDEQKEEHGSTTDEGQSAPEKKKDERTGGGSRLGPSVSKNMKIAQSSFWNNLFTVVLLLLILTTLYSFMSEQQEETEKISISQIAEQVKNEEVKEIIVRGDDLEVAYTDETRIAGEAKKETDAAITETLANLGVTAEQLSKIQIDVQNQTGFRYWLTSLAPFLFPILLLGLLAWFFLRQMKGAGMQALNFGSSKARIIDPNDKTQRVVFSDVAGVKEAKEELKEIVDFLRNPKKFLDIGARIPKGVILMGAPGSGKTLLARAVAGEAGVPFFTISGSEFVEMFVGVGASRVRDLFQMAKKAAPAIIFVDEIDAVGRVRGTGVGGGNDEREQTLNQILVEMDGFEPNEKVIVMAATNRPDVLDPALLRPGRFDRRITIDLPDKDDREAILKIHARKKPMQEDVNLTIIAQRTPGFSGADLYSLMNEAAILAARESRKKLGQFDLIRSIEKVMLGPERKSHIMNKREREITAYHEAGHALVASLLPFADPVHKISIISRGRAAGYTLKLPDTERRMQSKKEFMDDIATTLGGYVAERMVFDDLTTGPSNDLQVLTALARDMVMKYGMSDELGPVTYGNSNRLISGDMPESRSYSDEKSEKIDAEVEQIITEARERAHEILVEYRAALDAVAKRLLEVETLERDEYEEILKTEGVEIQDYYRDEEEKLKRMPDPTHALETPTHESGTEQTDDEQKTSGGGS